MVKRSCLCLESFVSKYKFGPAVLHIFLSIILIIYTLIILISGHPGLINSIINTGHKLESLVISGKWLYSVDARRRWGNFQGISQIQEVQIELLMDFHNFCFKFCFQKLKNKMTWVEFCSENFSVWDSKKNSV